MTAKCKTVLDETGAVKAEGKLRQGWTAWPGKSDRSMVYANGSWPVNHARSPSTRPASARMINILRRMRPLRHVIDLVVRTYRKFSFTAKLLVSLAEQMITSLGEYLLMPAR